MIYENLPRGRAKISSYIPTLPALRYLNCCTRAGWHSCNEKYRQKYDKGASSILLIYTVSGKGVMEMNDTKYSLCQNSVILVPPRTQMKYYTEPKTGSWEFYWLNLTGERILAIVSKLWQDNHYFIRNISISVRLFENILKETYCETERSSFIGEIIDRILSEAIFNASQKKSTADHILSYISDHYTEHIDLNKISELFFISQNQTIRMISARTGYTPHEYLTRLRLNKACELLQFTDTPIMDIGRSVGYSNNSHFSAVFRRIYGMSPAEYRAHFSN
ncbi:MAG: helix-turn-helix domain-containing protein [Clostridia bacterium]|nr:helix-turn-helix domain-containing protein [Clostridia bacterium]